MLVFFLHTSVATAAGKPPNSKVTKEVDDITADSGYRWLREGDARRSGDLQKGRFSGKGGPGGKGGGMPDAESSEGCSFEPNFQDWDPPEADADDGCGNSDSPDCACDPDIGSCNCDPTIGNCGACVPSPGALVPLGYLLGGLVLAVIVFFVVRALILRMPSEDTPLNMEDVDFDEEDMRVSRIHRVDPASLLDRANEAARTGDYKRAVGYLYLLSLSILSRGGIVELEKSTTNWNILRQTFKNGGPDVAMKIIVRHFEDLFFGNKSPTFERYEQVRQNVTSSLLPLEKEATHESS
ncbi:MAG: hypothetical protein JXR76_05075 [Deltaproteobacteria bacterium]|nr:hypothetical protein [Deltaproteobacteria bacterium]